MIVTVEQNQTDLAHMMELIRQGEEVVITRSGEPVAKLTGLVSMRPPGFFDDCYPPDEVAESNQLARHSIRRVVQ